MISNKIYIKLSLKISPLNPGKEILIAKLDQLEFEGFVEKTDGLECYISVNNWEKRVLDVFYPLEQEGIDVDWFIDTVEDKNWNSLWEQNYSPVFIGNSCVIRSNFHKKTNINHESIEIQLASTNQSTPRLRTKRRRIDHDPMVTLRAATIFKAGIYKFGGIIANREEG